jgi:MFS transporter, UMF1 family
MYDWANSAFATTVMAGFFPILFKSFWSADLDINFSTFILGLTNSLTGLIVAACAPVLGAIADKGSSRKKFLIFFAYLGVLMTSLLIFLAKGQWVAASVLYGIGIIGFSTGNNFYDSLLPVVAGEKRIDYVSGLGYAFGYLGGGILFLLNVLMTQKPLWFGLESMTEGARYSFLTVGVWWGMFAIPLILWVKEEKKPMARDENLILSGFKEVFRTFRKIRRLRETFIFLIGYWFYIDGVDTIIRMAVDFGMSIGFSSMDMILALLITQFVGFPSAIIYARLGARWGVKKLIFIGVSVYLLVTIYGMLMTQKYEFYVLAVAIGLVQGGVQALSRSFYSRLIPPEHEAEFYGFYNMIGKFAAIIGPTLMGIVGLVFAGAGFSQNTASRAGIGSIVILFILGGLFLYKVDEKRGAIDACELDIKIN